MSYQDQEAVTANSNGSKTSPSSTLDPPPATDLDAATEQFAKKIRQELGAVFVPSPDGFVHTFRDPSEEAFNQHGWYCFDKTGNAGVFGSIGCGEVWHWHSEQFSALPEKERHVINDQMREARERRTLAGDGKGDVAVCQKQEAPQAPTPLTVNAATAGNSSGAPIPLVSDLPPVKPLVAAMLPKGFVGFVMDVAVRLQIPADYIAVCAITVAAGIVGARYRIHPKKNDDWLVTATMWAGLVGPPSTMKSATMGAAQQPLHELEKELSAAHAEALIVHQLDVELAEDNLKEARKKAKALYGTDPGKAIQTIRDAGFGEPTPTRPRIVINDATIEKLGELLRENPNGLLLVRDELSGWFAKMGQEDYLGDRAFYLECFEGLNRFIWDRIGRGTIEIDNCVLSIIGGIQPSKIAPVIRSAVQGSADDGLVQRFQLAVWPDVQKGWKWIDRAPDAVAYGQYRDALRALHELPASGESGGSINLRFSELAQALYITWMEKVHADIRSDNLHPVMQSHLAKMPKTISGLALLFELIDGGRTEVGVTATAKAILWADYLQSHATRLYSLSTNTGMTGAKLMYSRKDKLHEVFRARDVLRKNWTGLSTVQEVTDALECLVEHRYLTELPVPKSTAGGRPSMRYRWHPSLAKKP